MRSDSCVRLVWCGGITAFLLACGGCPTEYRGDIPVDGTFEQVLTDPERFRVVDLPHSAGDIVDELTVEGLVGCWGAHLEFDNPIAAFRGRAAVSYEFEADGGVTEWVALSTAFGGDILVVSRGTFEVVSDNQIALMIVESEGFSAVEGTYVPTANSNPETYRYSATLDNDHLILIVDDVTPTEMGPGLLTTYLRFDCNPN